MTLGIIAALPQEIAVFLEKMSSSMKQYTIGQRVFYQGKIYNQDCVIVLARIGKVAASATCTTLIQTFGVDRIIFTGLAGGLHPSVNIGDIVIGTHFCQHDLNAEPLFPRYEVPLLGKSIFSSDHTLNTALHHSSLAFTHSLNTSDLSHLIPSHIIDSFKLKQIQIHQGLIISGDQFIHKDDAVTDLQNRFPDALCTEMEGAAIAQIAEEYQLPFAVIRIISDKANHKATEDFSTFLTKVAPFISSNILFNFLQNHNFAL
ncbi:5'-methylthioadenosine/adenosylhomocysteine nucleosidase [Pelistega ratti]|uniref:5'-methylthioadenosine/adenosylhomocysteine nucleosidase n=1 Tax=Pelistega ratti TaxID=2652177 RepID=UPI0013586785|nr:5'-methylthioadenosine/adenosylhomocysteine nucleosidase [Pelistega ratti]